ncbi:MAG TPA: long-chain-fatty-acid--CoA ligase [Acidimicrobiales bacterium]|nr:long-chain-fatty-acid--CoA ligase [Acidimicrobiales bacterium]
MTADTVDPVTPAEYRTASGMLRELAASQPDAPMLTAGDRTLTWGELYRNARRVAQALQAKGVGRGDRVAFLDRNGIEFFEVFFGCSLIGAVNVAVNWRLAPAEMGGIVLDSGAVAMLVGADYADAAKEIAAVATGVSEWVSLDELGAWLDANADPDPEDPGFEPAPGEVITQLYTSGTTGLPKGVMITGRNISALLTEADQVFAIGADTVSLVAMPLFHIGGSGWALSGMSRGGHSIIVRDIDPAGVLALIAEHRITETFVVPAVLMFMLATPELATTDVSSLRTVFYGASPISEDVLVRSMKALGCKFAQVYGLTETTGAITSLLPEDHDPDGPRVRLLQSAGRPFHHVELRIVDPDSGEPVPIGKVGEVVTRSTQNMLGYWNQPEATAAVLSEDDWFRTGDAGWLDGEGYLFLHDRLKDMIVSGGENIYPAEVENTLLSHAAVADAAVIGVPDDKWGETVKAIVVRAPETAGSDESLVEDILAFSRERLAHYKCPTSVDFIDALPRNPTGKVLKRELRKPYWAGRERNIQ